MVSRVDDIMALEHPDDVKQIEADMLEAFKCKGEGELKAYVSSKINIKQLSSGLATVKFTGPVFIQKLQDEYDISNGQPSKTPAVGVQTLVKGDGSGMLDSQHHKTYRSATATCVYIMQWSRSNIYNTIRGLELAPDTIWNANKDSEFTIHGRSDSDYAANTDNRRSVYGSRVFMNEAHVVFRSATQEVGTLLVTEAESVAEVMIA